MARDEKGSDPEAACEATLIRVIECARSASTSGLQRGGSVERTDPGSKLGLDAISAAQERLRQVLGELEPEMVMKLRTVMVAGRDRQDISAVRLELRLGDSDSAFAAAVRDTSENGPLLADYLQRGHALACAVGLDLEQPLSRWGAAAARTLDERAWLSFGKQLASSQPDDWQCLAFVQPGGQDVTRLYLRLGERAWWSFQAVLDRPSTTMMSKEKRSLSRRSKAVSTSSLQALSARLPGAPASAAPAPLRGRAEPRAARGVAPGRALRRAARAIQARVGQASSTP